MFSVCFVPKFCSLVLKFKFFQISDSLEHRCYKELRNENFHSAKIAMCIYRRLLVTCKEQM